MRTENPRFGQQVFGMVGLVIMLVGVAQFPVQRGEHLASSRKSAGSMSSLHRGELVSEAG